MRLGGVWLPARQVGPFGPWRLLGKVRAYPSKPTSVSACRSTTGGCTADAQTPRETSVRSAQCLVTNNQKKYDGYDAL
jgi:hypothetical protein